MQISIHLVLLSLIAALAVVADGVNMQAVCAKPLKGCGTQVKETSCTNWHGCNWSCGPNNGWCGVRTFNDGTTGMGCKASDPSRCCTPLTQAECDLKPTRIPTLSPTPPTNQPTTSPTVGCHTPDAGCNSLTASDACNAYNGCKFNTNSNVCQIGGCSGTSVPTLSPTRCTSIPNSPAGCGSQKDWVSCLKFNCCNWVSGSCVLASKPTPPPTMPKACSTLNRAGCKKRSDCALVKGKCIYKA